MRIGVISDTHGSIAGWESAVKIFGDIDLIIHCGDILNHGPKNPIPDFYGPKDLGAIINDFHIPVLIAKGNCDSEVDQIVIPDIPIQSPYVMLQDNNIRIMATHGHHETPEDRVQLAKKYKLNIIISGHTHIPILEKIDDIIVLNPGSPAIPMNKEKTKTCAVIENDEELKIKIFNLDGKIFKEVSL